MFDGDGSCVGTGEWTDVYSGDNGGIEVGV